jgi:hypothetical protein
MSEEQDRALGSRPEAAAPETRKAPPPASASEFCLLVGRTVSGLGKRATRKNVAKRLGVTPSHFLRQLNSLQTDEREWLKSLGFTFE